MMTVGALGVLGGAKETTWGTGVPPTFYIPFSSESFTDGPETMQELQIRGILDADPMYKGMQMVAGSFGGVAYPSILGHLLRAALGVPVTSGAGPYTHTFTPIQVAFATNNALPAYSWTVNRDSGQILRYEGMVCNKLGLKFSQNGILTYDSSWIGKDASVQTAPTVTLPTDVPFQLTASVLRNSISFPELQDLSLEITNTIEAVKTINNSDKINRVAWSGKRTLTMSMTADFASLQLYNDFKAFATVPWAFGFNQGGNVLNIAVPAGLIKTPGAQIGGDGRITLSASLDAMYDTATSRVTTITLTNAIVSY
jgi:Phage tail tube protein